jgi:protein-tyrosine-phosphatase
MAEEYLQNFAGDRFHVESAGLEPGRINPLVVEVMKEEGMDLSKKQTNSVFKYYEEGRRYDYVVTVCSKEAEERCPFSSERRSQSEAVGSQKNPQPDQTAGSPIHRGHREAMARGWRSVVI